MKTTILAGAWKLQCVRTILPVQFKIRNLTCFCIGFIAERWSKLRDSTDRRMSEQWDLKILRPTDVGRNGVKPELESWSGDCKRSLNG